MGRVVVAEADPATLGFSSAPSDRYVYSNYFVPVQLTFGDGETPVLPFYVKQALIEAIRYGGLSRDRLPHLLKELGLSEVWKANGMDAAEDALPGTDSGMTYREPPARRQTVLGDQEAEFVAGLLQSDVGIAFLDRTRIRPVGFALGEHVYALALAPGEEAVLEQRTYTKRELTLEEQNETEQQTDIELTSALTTELQEGFERQKSLTDTWGLNASHTGQYTSPTGVWGTFNASHTIGYTRSVTAASQETSRRAVKDSQSATSKVAARYRTQHKTDFKLVSETGMESTSKRTVRNPNRVTPITLHYFKVLQRLELAHERYGARVCWAPTVKDPALAFARKITDGRQRIRENALTALPPMPVKPERPAPGAPAAVETRTIYSPVVTLDKWGFTGDMSADYDIDIAFDSGWEWDGDIETIRQNLNLITRRPPSGIAARVVGVPLVTDADGRPVLRVRVHVGAASWLGGPGADVQLAAMFRRTPSVVNQNADDAAYNALVAGYLTDLKEWQDRRDEALADAETAGDDFEARLRAGFSPVNEMVSQIVDTHFPASVRDEAWEIDFWHRVFDWERASFVTYPGWWSGGDARAPERDPDDFLNASWAKLYLPVRAGMELAALRWIFGKAVATRLSGEVERILADFVDELAAFRTDHLGTADEMPELTTECQEVPEKVYCLAKWSELMPTDGTHLEVVQGATTAADAVTSREITDAEALRAALLDGEVQTNRLRTKAYDQFTEPADVDIHLGAAPGGPAA
ncbi:hypothetical protein O7598_00330 [Micromonospora sp. WMMC241]|uniref:hypothetical protein n=1 Tax=Micromonospora sp. WMMC241 TaxID=3015159 RepID=UPI0022B6EB8E|nr:hypothetical protein [Micromonospora sp. WMMC241]MCZ7434835.1 hypothetical protein [Micromonospora sp. WMMC241]